MSAQAISAATRVMRVFLTAMMAPGRSVTLLPPGEDPPTVGSGVNLYLYQVTESPYLKNAPYPGDRDGGAPRDVPVLSLDLSYLVTPFGPTPTADDETDEAHAALGEALLALHDAPVLTRVRVPGFDADTDVPAILRQSFADVTARLQPITIEDLSRIWSTIGKPFRLSVAYQLSLVQLSGTGAAPVVPEVVRVGVSVGALGTPVILGLVPPRGPLATLVAGVVTPRTVTVTGTGLVAEGIEAQVSVGGAAAPLSGSPAADQVTVSLPTPLRAGPEADVVVSSGGRAGRPVPFRLDPWAAALSPVRATFPVATDLVVTGAGFDTAVELVAVPLQGEVAGSAVTWSAPAAPTGTDAVTVTGVTGASSNLSPGSGLANGRYQVRVRLADDGLSNPRVLLVAPLVHGFTGGAASSYDAPQRRITLRGARLDGQDVRVRIDRAEYALGGHVAPAELAVQVARPLGAGPHTVEVVVDGYRSDAVTVTV